MRKAFNFIGKVFSYLKSRTVRVNNMYTHAAEQHYFELYYPHIRKHLAANSTIMDIGCQNGRFTIPLANEGHYVTATDINAQYFKFIKSHLNPGVSVQFRKEKITDTVSSMADAGFDAVLCLELLYTLRDSSELIGKMRSLLKPDGLFIASHRTQGYYLYRFLAERKFDDVRQILDNCHPSYNSQTPDLLKAQYATGGFDVLDIKPVGMFSGFSGDPFSFISNPEKLNRGDAKKLVEFENDPHLQSLFANNARYLLVVARAKNTG